MQTKLFGSFESRSGEDSIVAPGLLIRSNPDTSRFEKILHGTAMATTQMDSETAHVVGSDSPSSGAENSAAAISRGPRSISFSELVRELSGHQVLPIDLRSEEDVVLLKHISQALTAFVRRTQKSGQRFKANRINDVGKRFEYVIAEELRKTPLEIHLLGMPGYPDCMLKQGERISYLEIKTTASVLKKTNRSLNAFSLSSAAKIKSDGRHLLLRMQLEEEDSKIWRAVGWALHDISSLKTKLKTEFIAGSGDLAEVRLLVSSDKTLQSFARRRESFVDEPKTEATRPNNGKVGYSSQLG
jgi:hypothetical protein